MSAFINEQNSPGKFNRRDHYQILSPVVFKIVCPALVRLGHPALNRVGDLFWVHVVALDHDLRRRSAAATAPCSRASRRGELTGGLGKSPRNAEKGRPRATLPSLLQTYQGVGSAHDRHGEAAGQDTDHAVGHGTQKLHVAHRRGLSVRDLVGPGSSMAASVSSGGRRRSGRTA